MERALPVEALDSVEALRLRVQQLEAENAAMRPIVARMAEARMCRDTSTMVESCPHCSLKRGGVYGYRGKHDEHCMVSLARALGF
jgi:predicted nucleic acid binding AN1-type Zn finger protein